MLIISDDGEAEVAWNHLALSSQFKQGAVRVSLHRDGSQEGSHSQCVASWRLTQAGDHYKVDMLPFDAAVWAITRYGPFKAALVGPDIGLHFEGRYSSGTWAMASVLSKYVDVIVVVLMPGRGFEARRLSGAASHRMGCILAALFEAMVIPARRMRQTGFSVVPWLEYRGNPATIGKYQCDEADPWIVDGLSFERIIGPSRKLAIFRTPKVAI